MRDFGLGHDAPSSSVDFEPDPTLLVLFTPGDTVADWLKAGAALQGLWLTATLRGLAATPMTQLPEISALRALLAVLVDVSSSAGLVVVGSHGHGAIAGTLLGSISLQVLHHADCPVLIARSNAT
jgi:nucleotide-binding universal stress UspA family protein